MSRIARLPKQDGMKSNPQRPALVINSKSSESRPKLTDSWIPIKKRIVELSHFKGRGDHDVVCVSHGTIPPPFSASSVVGGELRFMRPSKKG